jgi:hypothetical protein
LMLIRLAQYAPVALVEGIICEKWRGEGGREEERYKFYYFYFLKNR